MKHKIYILFLIFVIYFFPIKILGFFATPDEHIYSAPFGVQGNNAGVKKTTVPLNLNQINIENFNNNNAETINTDKDEPLNNNLFPPITSNLNNVGKKSNSLFSINFWLTLFLILLSAVFIFLKRKKKNGIINQLRDNDDKFFNFKN